MVFTTAAILTGRAQARIHFRLETLSLWAGFVSEVGLSGDHLQMTYSLGADVFAEGYLDEHLPLLSPWTWHLNP
jgi:hypothetical protein